MNGAKIKKKSNIHIVLGNILHFLAKKMQKSLAKPVKTLKSFLKKALRGLKKALAN